MAGARLKASVREWERLMIAKSSSHDDTRASAANRPRTDTVTTSSILDRVARVHGRGKVSRVNRHRDPGWRRPMSARVCKSLGICYGALYTGL